MNKNLYDFFSRLNPALALLCLAVCCGMLLLSPGSASASQPMEAISKAQKGIDECDPDLFNEAVDVTSVINNGFDSLIEIFSNLKALGELDDNPGLYYAVVALTTGSAAQDMVKPMLISEAKTFVNAGIRGGYFNGEPNGKVSNTGQLGFLLDEITPGRKELVPGKLISQKGDSATVTAWVIDGDYGTFPLRLGLKKVDGDWQIKEILNAAELVKDVRF